MSRNTPKAIQIAYPESQSPTPLPTPSSPNPQGNQLSLQKSTSSFLCICVTQFEKLWAVREPSESHSSPVRMHSVLWEIWYPFSKSAKCSLEEFWMGRGSCEQAGINHDSEHILEALHMVSLITKKRASEVVQREILKGGRRQLQWVSWEGKTRLRRHLGKENPQWMSTRAFHSPQTPSSALSSQGPFSGPVNQMKDWPFSFVSVLTGNIRSPKEGLFQDYFGNYVWRSRTLPLFIILPTLQSNPSHPPFWEGSGIWFCGLMTPFLPSRQWRVTWVWNSYSLATVI